MGAGTLSVGVVLFAAALHYLVVPRADIVIPDTYIHLIPSSVATTPTLPLHKRELK